MQVYIDTLDEYHFVDAAADELWEGQEAETACRAERVYEAWKAAGKRSNNFVCGPRITSLGNGTDGVAGTRRLPEGFLITLIVFARWSLALPSVPIKHLQILAGGWVRATKVQDSIQAVAPFLAPDHAESALGSKI